MWTTLKKRSPHAHSHNKCKCQAQDDIDQEAALSFTSIRPIAHIRRAPPTDSPEEAILVGVDGAARGVEKIEADILQLASKRRVEHCSRVLAALDCIETRGRAADPHQLVVAL